MRRRRVVAFSLGWIAVGALALSGCGGSSGGGNGGAVAGSLKQPGLYGKLPAAGTATHGGTITLGQLNGTTPNYIFPIVPSGNAARPSTSGSSSCSCRCTTTSRTAASRDQLRAERRQQADVQQRRQDGHDHAEAGTTSGTTASPRQRQGPAVRHRADQGGGQREPGQLGLVHARLLPAEPPEHHATGPYTVVMHLKHAFNPGFFLNNHPGANLYPLPSTDWNVASRGRPASRLERPGERQEDLRLPRQGGRPGRHVRHQPAVEGRRRTVRADELQPDDSSYDEGQHQLRRHAEAVDLLDFRA